MSTIAVHRETGTRYVLLGAGIRTFTPSAPLPDAARRKQGVEAPRPVPITMVALCDAEGTIVWYRSEEVRIVEVDAQTPTALLQRNQGYR
jgi:hypothetical protein